MPVPLTATNPNGVGLAGYAPDSLPTLGPFARLAAAQNTTTTTSNPADTTPGPRMEMEVDAATLSSDHLSHSSTAISVSSLKFSYPGLDGRPIPGLPPLIKSMNINIDKGSRVLLLGANGAGKTTLLKILAGKHLINPEDGSVRVLGRPPFQDTLLTSSGDLAYIGGTWTRDVAFAGTAIPLTGDFPASKMMALPGACPIRKARLIEALDVDPTWRMHQVSDGQRRRVQLVVGLLRPFKVLLLDEVTVDLDVLGRANLMQFLKEETDAGATVVYCTHIFEGLESWPSHIAYIAGGEMRMFAEASKVPELSSEGSQGAWERGLLGLVCRLLLAEESPERRAARVVEWDPSREGQVNQFSYAFNNGWVPGTLGASIDLKGSTNAVMRN